MPKDSHPKQIPFKQAMSWILLSILFTTGSALLSLLYYRHVRDSRVHDDAYLIKAIVQTSSEQELLKTVYFAELLDLSIDRPTNLFQFNTREAKAKLLSSPLIRNGVVKKIRPGTIHIDYVLRKPIAFLLDYTNTAIDRDGYLFPVKPFLTPKKLPEIYLGLGKPNEGLNPGVWGKFLKGKQVELAMNVLNDFISHSSNSGTQLLRIDVSKIDAASCGQQEIVVILEEHLEREMNGRSVLITFPRTLRLNPFNYQQALANYYLLREHLLQQALQQSIETNTSMIRNPPVIIDLRLSQLAFMGLDMQKK